MNQKKTPRDDDRHQWTNHVFEKMRYYGLSEGRVRRVLHSPKRVEEGVAPGTTAIMQPGGTLKHPYEVWVMYQNIKSKIKNQKSKLMMKRRRIISAWKYPGVSKPRGEVPVPDDIRRYVSRTHLQNISKSRLQRFS